MNRQARQGENELRIRAAVRAVLSPGVWLVIAVRVFIVVLWSHMIVPASVPTTSEAGPTSSMALLVTLSLFVYAYLFGGALRSFVVGDGRVSVPEILKRGKDVFNQFVWLCIKALLVVLLMAVFFLSASVTGASDELEVQARFEEIAPTMNLIGTIALFIVPFLLVYWLPLVFVTRDFRMFSTMRAAVVTLWRRLSTSGYLAFLVLFPVALFWLVPDNVPLVVVLALGILGDLMRWTARVYCAQYLVKERGAIARAASG
jgi:hypothetical protein